MAQGVKVYVVDVQNQDELKLNVKLWLKANNCSYSWLAERCYVTESTVRNWMARKTIPAAKEHIIRELIKQNTVAAPTSAVQVKEETLITFSLDADTRKALEAKAFSQGQTLAEFLSESVSRMSRE